MLRYNFDRIFYIRGIERPYTFLLKAGFSDNFATRIKNNRVARLNLGDLERLCLLLHCTPDDLMEWVPDTNSDVGKEHSLAKLSRSGRLPNLVRTLYEVPPDQVEEIEKMIREKTGKV